MPRLPRLVAELGEWRLPLADHVSRELVRILTVDSPVRAAEATAELMAVDPAFALWLACTADRWQTSPPHCVSELAAWFARYAVDVLRWTGEEPLADRANALPSRTRGLTARWRELSVNSIAVATIASDLAANDIEAAESFLFGLLHNALDWLRTAGPRVALADVERSCLPAWLATLLRQRSTKQPRSAVAEHVARAVAVWRKAEHNIDRVPDSDLNDVRQVRRWWQTPVRDDTAKHAPVLPALVEKLARLKQLEHRFHETLEQEKLASLGELAYGASHEINNPLANISTRAQTLLRDETNPERRRTLAIINTQAFRANEMIADMMLFARPPRLEKKEVDLVELAAQVGSELAVEADLQGTELQVVGPDGGLIAAVDPVHLSVALRAVCLNALEALGGGGQIEVRIDQITGAPGDAGAWCRICVADTGPGISPEVRRHLFDPFFSGREAGRGLGLGLSKCWRIVTDHGGRIEVQSELGKGTEMTLYLPQSQ